MKKIIILLALVSGVIINCYSQDTISKHFHKAHPFLDSLEIELRKLKNQAFCNCFYEVLKNANAEITPVRLRL